MTHPSLLDLQTSVIDTNAFEKLDDYFLICQTLLDLFTAENPTRIISPTDHNYVFFQYGGEYAHRITRPINTDLFIESPENFKTAYERFTSFLDDVRNFQDKAIQHQKINAYCLTNEVNQVVYTIQQSIGCIGDSFENPNQSRKRIGQLFEKFVKMLIQQVGLECESRTINIPIPGFEGQTMSYELDLVISKNKAVITAETNLIHPSEFIGSVKTTSKDRIDKIFLDKFMLTKLLGRNIPVVAIFLHDVQRAKKGNSIFGINSTFKSNPFLGYTVSLNKLDGVYYVDPRPVMVENARLQEHIQDFQQFLIKDLCSFSNR
ncbi:MAG: hypothetical protein Fur0022_21380 [Anaerolineales bacterium]